MYTKQKVYPGCCCTVSTMDLDSRSHLICRRAFRSFRQVDWRHLVSRRICSWTWEIYRRTVLVPWLKYHTKTRYSTSFCPVSRCACDARMLINSRLWQNGRYIVHKCFWLSRRSWPLVIDCCNSDLFLSASVLSNTSVNSSYFDSAIDLANCLLILHLTDYSQSSGSSILGSFFFSFVSWFLQFQRAVNNRWLYSSGAVGYLNSECWLVLSLFEDGCLLRGRNHWSSPRDRVLWGWECCVIGIGEVALVGAGGNYGLMICRLDRCSPCRGGCMGW